MKARRFTVLMAALYLVMALGLTATATTDPLPSPSLPTQVLTEFVPELMELPAPQWLMTGYRFFYDVYQYDKEDNITSSQTLIIDTVGKGGTYMLSEIYMASFDESGALLTFEQVDAVRHGHRVAAPEVVEAGKWGRAISEEGELVALIEYDAEANEWQPRKVFFS